MYFGRLLAGFIGVILFIIIVVMLFGHGGKKPVVNPVQPLPSYADTDATVSFTTQGIVNADELHRSIRITVSNSQMELDVLQGYNPVVIQSKTFANNAEAYSVFLKSINYSGFLAKTKNVKIPNSEQGLCPLGFRYILELNQDGTDLSRTWASTCGSKVGTSTGAVSTIRQLFQNQIPDYDRLVSNVNLSSATTSTNSL
jgi:hypothetical protein